MKRKVNNVSSMVKGFQTVLRRFLNANKESTFESKSAEFAYRRVLKKLEVPNVKRAQLRAQQCWDSWLEHDFSLPDTQLNEDAVTRTRLGISHALIEHGFKLTVSDEIFTNGSTYIPTHGRNSIEEKLQNMRWSVTEKCYDHFMNLVLKHRALKYALRAKLLRYYGSKEAYKKAAYAAYVSRPSTLSKRRIGEYVLKVLARNVTEITLGSRFSTVPKNNEKDRPINLEPFGNILVQRQIGLALRDLIYKAYGIDLRQSQNLHAKLISGEVATIDLKSASDSMSKKLIRRLFPERIYNLLMETRSPYVEHSSGDIAYPYKISSMGNGFTFELMTLVLLAGLRSLDHTAMVYGDDIIVSDHVALHAIQHVTGLGFTVNEEKTFYGDSDFRESCGANYFRNEGYVLSYDITWPHDDIDCMVLFNKLVLIHNKYHLFEELVNDLKRLIPMSLRPKNVKLDVDPLCDTQLDIHFLVSAYKRKKVGPHTESLIQRYCYRDHHVYKTLVRKCRLVNRTDVDLQSYQYGKYFSYLRSGRIVDNVHSGITRVRYSTMIQLDDNPWAIRLKDITDS